MTTLREAWERESRRFYRSDEPDIPTALESARDRYDAAIIEQARAVDEYAATLQAHEDAKVRLSTAEDEYDAAQDAYRHALLATEKP